MSRPGVLSGEIWVPTLDSRAVTRHRGTKYLLSISALACNSNVIATTKSGGVGQLAERCTRPDSPESTSHYRLSSSWTHACVPRCRCWKEAALGLQLAGGDGSLSQPVNRRAKRVDSAICHGTRRAPYNGYAGPADVHPYGSLCARTSVPTDSLQMCLGCNHNNRQLSLSSVLPSSLLVDLTSFIVIGACDIKATDML